MKKIIVAIMVLLAVNAAFAKHVCYVSKSDSIFHVNKDGDSEYERAMTIFYYVKNSYHGATISNTQRLLSIRRFHDDQLREATFMAKEVGDRGYYYSYTKYDRFGIVVDSHTTDMSLTTIGSKWSEFTDNCGKYIEVE
jgi:hypothetical protein